MTNSTDPNKVENHLPDDQLYLGAGVQRLLQTTEIAGNKDLLKDIKSRWCVPWNSLSTNEDQVSL